MFGSSWGTQNNTQQQQQPGQQGTSTFGQPSGAFGSGGGFGSGAFGQATQQQPQQPVNPMFGGATNSTNTTTPAAGAFGAFGGGTSAFGAKPPAFGGGGAFGGTSGGTTTAFGGGGPSAFGQTNPDGSGAAVFGQPSTTTGVFGGGTGGGLFGQKPAAPAGTFGAPSQGATGTNADGATNGIAAVTTGSSNPPYSAFSEKDTSGAQHITLHYQSISCMPAYRGTSFEEIRLQDYAQGRKTAGAFGQSAVFGMNPSQSGNPAAPTGFGHPTASTSTFGGFGQSAQNTTQPTTGAFGAFGQPATSQPSAFGGGTSTFGTFGQQNQQQQQTTQPSTGTGLFGAFGQNGQQQQPAQPTTSTFGGGGPFGSTQNKPFGTFGSTSGTGAFGTGGAFGQNNQQQQQQQQQQQPGQTGTIGTGLFGQPANQQQGTTGTFGGFGAKPSVFGQPATQAPTTGFGLFGQNQQNQQQNQSQPQQPSTGIFGGGSGGLFGQQNQNQQPGQPGQPQQQQSTTGLFGQQPSQPASTGLFGNNIFGQTNNQPKPAFGTGLFGQNNNQTTTQPAQQTSIFGQPLSQQPQTAPGTNAFGTSSLFGAKPPTTSAFGQSSSQQGTGLGGSLFGGNALGASGGGFGGTSVSGPGGPQGAGTLTASVAEPVQTNLPIFSLLQSGPQATVVDAPPKKPSSYFVDVPTRSPLGLSTSRIGGGKLRGFGFSQSGLLRNTGLSSTMMLSSSAPSPLSLSKMDNRGLLGPEAFLGSSSLGGDGKPSPKKLVLDRKMDPSDVFGRSAAKGSASPKVAFNPAMSVAAREREGFGYPSASKASPINATSPAVASPGKKSTPLGPETPKEKATDDLQEGDYWVEPGLDVLRNMSNSELSAFKGLIVGRKGYGEVHFLEPVDLTALPRLSALLGKIVQIDSKECCVYPDSGEGDDLKPPPGEGINVRARIILYGCWPVDKATREPIKDEKHPSFAKHAKRLRTMKHTHFESYTIEDGKWTFTVDHF